MRSAPGRRARRAGGWALALVVALTPSGCVSWTGSAPEPPARDPLPLAEPICGDYRFRFVQTVFGEPEDGQEAGAGDVEEAAIAEVLWGANLVGHVGQAGLGDTALELELTEDLDTFMPLGILSVLSLLTVPFWMEVEYGLDGRILQGEAVLARATARQSVHVLVQNPLFLFTFWWPHPDGRELVARLARVVLADLAGQAAER